MYNISYFLVFFQIFKYDRFIIPHLNFNTSKSKEMLYLYRVDFFIFNIFLFSKKDSFLNNYAIIFDNEFLHKNL